MGALGAMTSVAQEKDLFGNEQRSEHGHAYYLALYGFGTMPIDRNIVVGGQEIPGTKIPSRVGGGLKAGIFPSFAQGILGIEGEIFGHQVEATTSGSPTSFVAVVTMVNLVARYPGELFQPYVGIGGGHSTGYLTKVNGRNISNPLEGDNRENAWGYQFLGGIRVMLSGRIFGFAEYKYLVMDHKWSDATPTVALDFRTHYAGAGLGLSF
jgi:opacity protein-like surface antigen